MNLLKQPTSVRSSVGGLCFDISELGRSFRDFEIKWVSRDANQVAHTCATMVSPIARSFFWIESVPDWLATLAAVDCTPVSN